MNSRFVVRAVLGMIAALAAGAAAAGGAAEPATDGPPTFAAHDVHGGLAVDQMKGGEPATVTAPGWLRMPGQPEFVVPDGNGREAAALWITAPSTVVVRKGSSTNAPLDGRVEPSWENESIRLSIEPAGGPVLKSDVFQREDLGAGPRELTRRALLSTDVVGSYRAILRTADGRPVGWLRVRISTHGASPIRYEAALPPQVDEALAVALAEALDDEIDRIERESNGVHRAPERRP